GRLFALGLAAVGAEGPLRVHPPPAMSTVLADELAAVGAVVELVGEHVVALRTHLDAGLREIHHASDLVERGATAPHFLETVFADGPHPGLHRGLADH